jgi:hypothetical protein
LCTSALYIENADSTPPGFRHITLGLNGGAHMPFPASVISAAPVLDAAEGLGGKVDIAVHDHLHRCIVSLCYSPIRRYMR